MSFRTRLLISFLAATVIPILALGLLVRHEMTKRLTSQYQGRVDALVAVVQDDVDRARIQVQSALAELGETIIADNRFRRAAMTAAPEERRYLLDYASTTMPVAGLAMLQIQDATGRILSSGHFRNDYDRVDVALPRLLNAAPQHSALVRARTPMGSFLALACVDTVAMGNRRFVLVGGVSAEASFLQGLVRDGALQVALTLPGDSSAATVDTTAAVVRELSVPFADVESGVLSRATLRVAHATAELDALRASIDRWFVIAVALAAIVAVIAATWLASRLSRPLVELAEKTSRIDLDNLDIEFNNGRHDEIGALSSTMGRLTERLRESTVQLKDAERRATLGELARQVNHDIKNGLTPIRNVFRHLSQQSQSDPAQLPKTFAERSETLDQGIAYLENLATSYARLSRRGDAVRCDLNDIVGVVARDRSTATTTFEIKLAQNAVVWGDVVALRRIVENLTANAVDSGATHVTIATEVIDNAPHGPTVRLSVADNGSGMDESTQSQIFNDFYSTKRGGTGLGLSIVRRLVMDLGGTISVHSQVGTGTRFVVELPVAQTRKVES